jgi:hypothetical protein
MPTDAVAPAAMSPLRREDITRTEDCRRTTNASAVLLAALDHGPVARSTIARLTGLSPAAVSRLCAELAASGLLREVPEAGGPKRVGRPHVPVEIDVGRRVACGLHIAVGHATLALLDLRGRVIARERLAHAGAGPRDVLLRVAHRIPGFLNEHAGGRIPVGLGVASGGWVDHDRGVIMENALLGWCGVPVRELMAPATGMPGPWRGLSRCSATSARGPASCTCSLATWLTPRSRPAAPFITGRARRPDRSRTCP